MVSSPGDVVSNTTRFAILTVSTVVFQVSLLALFLYPLIRHRAAMKAYKVPTQSTMRRKSNSSVRGSNSRRSSRKQKERKFKRQRAIVKVIRRVMITAVLCAISDVFCGLIVRVVVDDPRIVTNLIFDANLLINLGCVLASFKDWRQRLFPCCPKKRSFRRRNSELPTARPSSTTAPNYAKDHFFPADNFPVPEHSNNRPITCSSESGIHSFSPPAEASVSDLPNDHLCYTQGTDSTKF